VHDGFVVARPCDHRPSISRGMIAWKALGRENEIFLAFQTLFKQTSNASEHVLQ